MPGAVSGWAALRSATAASGSTAASRRAIDAAERGFAVTPVIAAAGVERRRRPAGAPSSRRHVGLPPRRASASSSRLPELGGDAARHRRATAPTRFYRGRWREAICQAASLARRGRPGRARSRVGRAARSALPRRRRAASCRRTARALPRCRRSALLEPFALGQPADARSRAPAGRGAQARLRRRGAPHRRRPAPRRLPGRRLPRRAPRADRPRRAPATRRPGRCRAAARSTCAPSTSSARLLADPEPVLRLRRAASPHPAPASRCRTAAPASRSSPATRTGSAPGKRPFHTIIPGMLLRDGAPARAVRPDGRPHAAAGPPAGRVALLDRGLDPQAALDEPRFRLDRDGATAGRSPWRSRSTASRRRWRGAATACSVIPPPRASAAAR